VAGSPESEIWVQSQYTASNIIGVTAAESIIMGVADALMLVLLSVKIL
jgi:hypothetical protein